MKFVFLKSGDYLEFTPRPTEFVSGWFGFLFRKGIAQKFSGERECGSTVSAESKLSEINKHIDDINNFLNIRLPNADHFKNNPNLNQQWLNDTHKQWVYMNERYKNEVYDIPDTVKQSWMKINSIVHNLEAYYQHEFNNDVILEMPKSENLIVKKEDCEFTQHDLMLSYKNLGRHQYNQWQVGYDTINEETNNYTEVTTSFSFYHNVENYNYTAPPEYVKWCEQQNIEILAPWVVLGTFNIPDPWEVKEIMHRNLKDNSSVGFEL